MRIFKRYYFTIATKFVQNNDLIHIYKYMTYIERQTNVKQIISSNSIKKILSL